MNNTSYNIKTNGKITHVTLQGEIDIEILRQIETMLWEGKDYQNPCVLLDFRACVAGIGPQDLQELRRSSAGDKGERGYGRVALVVEKDLHFQLAKKYEHLAQDLPFETKSFRNIEAAQCWLQEM